MVLGSGGEVHSFGYGIYGQLGCDLRGEIEQLAPQVIEVLKGVRVSAVAAGYLHSLVLGVGGDAYSFGRGEWGHLGHGDRTDQLEPKRIESVANVRAVAARVSHSMLLTEAGVVYSFGDGKNGRLGHNNMDDQLQPLAVEALCGVKVRAIAVSGQVSLAVAAGGAAYGWGRGGDATLGFGLTKDQPTPLQYPGLQLRL